MTPPLLLQVVGLGERFARVARLVDVGLGDEHLERWIVERVRVVLGGRLEMRLDPGCVEKLLELLSFGHVACERNLHEPCHVSVETTAARLVRAPLLTSSGEPRSENGIPMTSKSRGTSVAGKSSRASSTT